MALSVTRAESVTLKVCPWHHFENWSLSSYSWTWNEAHPCIQLQATSKVCFIALKWGHPSNQVPEFTIVYQCNRINGNFVFLHKLLHHRNVPHSRGSVDRLKAIFLHEGTTQLHWKTSHTWERQQVVTHLIHQTRINPLNFNEVV